MKKLTYVFTAFFVAFFLLGTIATQAQTLVEHWGGTGQGTGWPILNDATTPAGDAGMGADAPPPSWATIRGSFGQTFEATASQAVVVSGQFEYVGDGPGESYVGLRYALTFQGDSLMNPNEGTLMYENTDSAYWSVNGPDRQPCSSDPARRTAPGKMNPACRSHHLRRR